MSIVVTCSCTRTWRLPDKYAGKRCRCRDCGEPIEVPREAAAKRDAGRKGGKASGAKPRKDPAARQTTRRLNSQDREIIGERRRIRSSERRVPVSESMHQLAPIALSGDRLDLSPAAPLTKKRAAATATKAREKAKAAPKAQAKVVEPPAKAKKAKKGAKAGKAKADPKSNKKKKPAGKAGKAEPARGRDRRAKGRAAADEEQEPQGMNRRVAGVPLVALLGIAAALCLGIGLAVGGLIGKGGGGAAAAPDLDKKFASFEQLKASRKWADAKKELDLLATQLAGDEAGLARVKANRPGVDAMAQIAGIEDDEARLLTLVDNIGHRDAAIRLAIVTELRELSEHEPAQGALGKLATDADPRVADSAQQGLVAAGGKHSIPWLGKAIEQAAASGHKIGEIALNRALELDDPAVVPVLLTALKARSNAPAGVLKAILKKLEDHGDAKCADAVKPFLDHKDAGVKDAAQRVLDAIG